MKVVSVIGARPQIIKAAHLTPWLLDEGIEEVLVHSGQHFSESMSANFFEEFELHPPRYNLNVNQLSRSQMVSAIIEKLEPILKSENPQACIVYGDTNTTLAAALTASFLRIPVIHVEAGLRSSNHSMPEESNRILTDHLADLNLAPNSLALANLERENTKGKSVLAGDIMQDSLASTLNLISSTAWGREPQGVLVTIHREELTNDQQCLRETLGSLSNLSKIHQVRLVRHPRLDSNLLTEMLGGDSRVQILEPMSHGEIVSEMIASELIVTDSGGLQREASLLRKRCLILRTETEWGGLLSPGFAELVAPGEQIYDKARKMMQGVTVETPKSLELGLIGRQMSLTVSGFLRGQGVGVEG